MDQFCLMNYLKNLVAFPACNKNPEKPTNIDLIMTNKSRNF